MIKNLIKFTVILTQIVLITRIAPNSTSEELLMVLLLAVSPYVIHPVVKIIKKKQEDKEKEERIIDEMKNKTLPSRM